jgi:hypothetical protein
MKKIQHAVLGTAMVFGSLISTNIQAQQGPCGWDLISQVTPPTCFGSCDGSILVTPSVNLPNVVYMWADGSSNNYLNNLCEEEYVLIVEDDKKCQQSYTFSVVNPAQVLLNCSVVVNESAPGAANGSVMVAVSGGFGPYEYEWQGYPSAGGSTLSGLSAGVYTVTVYDDKKCPATVSCEVFTDEKKECEGFRTQTQGGWGQCQQNGNNPGSYLFNHFAASFPNGLTIGCGTSTLHLSSAQAVCDFLPSGTTPALLPLNTNMVNPGAAYLNVFAGQLVAATLNAKFDADDANFGANSDYTLGELVFTSGVFANMSVNDVIAEANKKIGRCGSPFKISELKNAMAHVNENYVNGTTDLGYLTCPDDKKNEKNTFFGTANLTVKVFPNPVTSASKITIYSDDDQDVKVDIYNVAGQRIANLFNAKVLGGDNANIIFDAASLTNGMYFIKIISGDNVINHKILVTK